MARVGATGAETGSTNELDAVTVTGVGTFVLDASVVRSGSSSWKAAILTNDATASCGGGLIFAASSTGCVRFSFRVGSGAPTFVVVLSNTLTGDRIGVSVSSASMKAAFLNSVEAVAGTNSSLTVSLPQNVWHNVYVRWSIGGSGTAKQVWFSANGSEEGTNTAPASGWSTTTIGQVGFGNAPPPLTGLSNNQTTIYFDDIIIDNANEAIDHGRYVHALRPSSDVTTGWTSIGGGPSNHAASLADNTAAGGIRTNGSAVVDVFEMTDLSLSGTPSLIKTLYGGFRHGAPDGASTEQPTDSCHLDYLDGNSTIISQGPNIAGSTTAINTPNATIYNWAANSKTLADLNSMRVRVQNSASAVRGYLLRELWVNAEIVSAFRGTDTGTIQEEAVPKAILALDGVGGRPGDSALLDDVISSLTNRFEQVETITFVDVLSSLKAILAVNDSAINAASVTSIKNWLSLVQTKTLVESNAIFVRFERTDAAALVDLITSIKSTITLSDTVEELVVLDNMVFVSILLSSGGRKVIFGIFD